MNQLLSADSIHSACRAQTAWLTLYMTATVCQLWTECVANDKARDPCSRSGAFPGRHDLSYAVFRLYAACRQHAGCIPDGREFEGGDHAGAGAEGEGGGGTVRVGSVKFPPSVLCAAAACNFSSPCARQRFGAFSAGSGLRTTRLCRLCEPSFGARIVGPGWGCSACWRWCADGPGAAFFRTSGK